RDGERQMSRAKTRMPVLLDVRRRSSRPVHQIQMQLVARRFETRRVQLANGRRLGRGIDEIVEPIDQPANTGVAADQLEMSWRRHSEKYPSVQPVFVRVDTRGTSCGTMRRGVSFMRIHGHASHPRIAPRAG